MIDSQTEEALANNTPSAAIDQATPIDQAAPVSPFSTANVAEPAGASFSVSYLVSQIAAFDS